MVKWERGELRAEFGAPSICPEIRRFGDPVIRLPQPAGV